MPNYKKYAELRDARGLSDRQVARGSGINPSTIYAWAHGEYQPKLDKISKLAAYFGVKLEDLLGE